MIVTPHVALAVISRNYDVLSTAGDVFNPFFLFDSVNLSLDPDLARTFDDAVIFKLENIFYFKRFFIFFIYPLIVIFIDQCI